MTSTSGSFENYVQYSNGDKNNGNISNENDPTVLLNKRFHDFGINDKMQISPVKAAPPGRSPWFGINEWETEKKEKMSKDEIEELRKSVLRTNRPVNPWYETQKKMGSTNNSLTTSPSSTTSTTSCKSGHSTHNYSNYHGQPFENVASTSHASITTYRARAVRVDNRMGEIDKDVPASAENQRLWKSKPNGLGWQKNDHKNASITEKQKSTQPGLCQFQKRPLPGSTNSAVKINADTPNREQTTSMRQTKRAEDYAVDLTQMLASDIKLLEELEAEHLERKSIISSRGRNTADTSPMGFTTVEKLPNVNKTDSNFSTRNSHLGGKTASGDKGESKLSQQPISSPQHVQVIDAQICAACRKPITDVVLQALGNSFHPRCFRCDKCSICLDGVPFAVANDGRVFCMRDYERVFAVPCTACHQPITSNNEYGQVVRVIVHGNEYHLECYSCEACGIRLNNEPGNQCYPIGSHLLCRACHIQWSRLSDGLDQPITDL